MADKDNAVPVQLEVMVAAYGMSGINRVASPGQLEPTPGVRYLVSWQPGSDYAEQCVVPEQLAVRNDVVVRILGGVGVSRNRNNLLDMATAPYLLCADDDVQYKASNLRKIIRCFDENPTVDVAVFRIDVDEPRRYPVQQCRLNYAGTMRTFYPCICEIAMRRCSVQRADVRFDEQFGINAPELGAGEDDMFIYDAWRANLNITFFPVEILRHVGHTSEYTRRSDAVYRARGAVLHTFHPRTSLLRIVKLAVVLAGRCPWQAPRIMRQMIRGRRYARSNTPRQ